MLIFGTSDKYLTVRAAEDSATFVKDFRLELLEGVSLDCDTKKWLNVTIVFLQIHDSFWPIVYNLQFTIEMKIQVSHWVQQEAPEAVNNLIEDFLNNRK